MKENTRKEVLDLSEKEYRFEYPKELKAFLETTDLGKHTFNNGIKEITIANLLIPKTTGLFERIMKEKQENSFLPKDFIPFARDRGDDLFCFSILDSKVYLFYPTDEEPAMLCDNILVFLDNLE